MMDGAQRTETTERQTLARTLQALGRVARAADHGVPLTLAPRR